jgi:hypothetical protein
MALNVLGHEMNTLFKAQKSKSVLPEHAHLVFTFLRCIAEDKNNISLWLQL